MEPPLIYYGLGTGRSGTSVLIRLLGSYLGFSLGHTDFHRIIHVLEVMLRKFNDDVIERFLENLRGWWFCLIVREGQPGAYDAGLFEKIEAIEMERIIINTFLNGK